MRILFRVVALGVVSVITGCTGAQMESARMQRVGNQTSASAMECLQAIRNDPEYASLQSKIYFGTDNQYPLQMLNDKTRPNKNEIGELYKVYSDVQNCRKIILEGAAKMHPLVLATFIGAFAEGDRLWAKVTSGQLTWGEFNQDRKALVAQEQQKLIQADLTIGSQLQNQHQFEIVQRQRAAEAMQQWAYQQQQLQNQRALVNAVNQPRMSTIHCNYFGNTANCNSY